MVGSVSLYEGELQTRMTEPNSGKELRSRGGYLE